MQDIINQSEPEMPDKNQISEKKFYNVKDCELKFLRFRFWIKFFAKRQISNWNFYNATDFEEKFFLKSTILKKKLNSKSTILKKKLFLKSRFWKNFCTPKITFWLILPRKRRKLCVWREKLKGTILKKKIFFKKHDIEEKFF